MHDLPLFVVKGELREAGTALHVCAAVFLRGGRTAAGTVEGLQRTTSTQLGIQRLRGLKRIGTLSRDDDALNRLKRQGDVFAHSAGGGGLGNCPPRRQMATPFHPPLILSDPRFVTSQRTGLATVFHSVKFHPS